MLGSDMDPGIRYWLWTGLKLSEESGSFYFYTDSYFRYFSSSAVVTEMRSYPDIFELESTHVSFQKDLTTYSSIRDSIQLEINLSLRGGTKMTLH